MSNVFPLSARRHQMDLLVAAIKEAVYENGRGMSVAEAIGALEIAKLEIYDAEKTE